MVAKSGHHLLRDDAVAALRDTLVPLARVITPNLPEAGVLIGEPAPATHADMRQSGARTASAWPGMGIAEGWASHRR